MKYAKAITAAAIAALTALGTALTDGSVTAAEWTGVVLAGLVSLGAVWGIPNTRLSDTTTVTIDRTDTSPIDRDNLPRDLA